MSLTSLLSKRRDIREGFASRIVRPHVRFGQQPLRAPPLTANHSAVGTAFDYLLRFVLQRINPHSESSPWIAEHAIESIGGETFSFDLDRRRLTSRKDPKRRDAQGYLEEAKNLHRQFLADGIVTNDLLRATLRLAYMDLAYRIGPRYVDWQAVRSPDPSDVQDLQAMLTLVDQKAFRSHRTCLLNPTFGTASRLVGGADADVLLDGCLIDIKTTKHLGLESHDLYQIVGYYVLAELGGVECSKSKRKTEKVRWVGLYFARYGLLWTIPAHEVLPRETVRDFAAWFVQAVCNSKAKRTSYLRSCRGQLAATLLTSLKRPTPKKTRPTPTPSRRRLA